MGRPQRRRLGPTWCHLVHLAPVVALAFTSATLAAVDALAQHDRAAQLTQTSSSVERG